MSTQSLQLVDKVVEEEELLEMERMEIRSRVESPSRSANVLEKLMTSISSQLKTVAQQQSFMSQQQGHFSNQLSAMSHQQGSLTSDISVVQERLDRVEKSLQGSGKGARAQTTGSRVQELPPARSSRLDPQVNLSHPWLTYGKVTTPKGLVRRQNLSVGA